MGIGNVGGVIEVDEAFFRESFKGDHKKSTTFTMPREVSRRNRFAFYVPWIEQGTL